MAQQPDGLHWHSRKSVDCGPQAGLLQLRNRRLRRRHGIQLDTLGAASPEDARAARIAEDQVSGGVGSAGEELTAPDVHVHGPSQAENFLRRGNVISLSFVGHAARGRAPTPRWHSEGKRTNVSCYLATPRPVHRAGRGFSSATRAALVTARRTASARSGSRAFNWASRPAITARTS